MSDRFLRAWRAMTRASAVAVVLATAGSVACVARPRMCAQPAECGSQLSCVAGRCQPATGLPAIQAVDDRGTPLVRRVVREPVEIAWVRRGGGPAEAKLPTLLPLGRASDGDAILFLRFSLPLTKSSTVLEAYLLLERSDLVDADPAPLSLHLARVIDPWDAHSVSWALQPRTEGARSPATVVPIGGRGVIRLDARRLVESWRLHPPNDFGIAVVADHATATGVSFSSGSPPGALASPPMVAGAVAPTEVDSMGPTPMEMARGAGPRLEVYLK